MSAQSKAVDIPIQKEPKTFEQHRRSMLTSLEHRPSETNSNEIVPHHDEWAERIHSWADSSWESFHDEMRRMRRDMFALLPLEHFGMQHWGGFDTLQPPFALMHQMEDHIEELRRRMGFTDAPVTGALTDYLKDAYEVGEDGKVHFKVRFDAKGFTPDDIKVSTTDDCLTVHAKKTMETDKSRSSREFCRMLKLPHSIDQSHLQCHLTQDGVLMLEAPVNSADYRSITFNDNRKLGIRPKSESEVKTTSGCKVLEVKGVTGPIVLDDGVHGKRLHLELPIDSMYKPEDICVNVDSNRLLVSGKHHKVSKDKHIHSTSQAEFCQSYEIPETVDPLSISAQIIGKNLILEAPLMK